MPEDALLSSRSKSSKLRELLLRSPLARSSAAEPKSKSPKTRNPPVSSSVSARSLKASMMSMMFAASPITGKAVPAASSAISSGNTSRKSAISENGSVKGLIGSITGAMKLS